MTRTANARLAGITFLLYIATGITSVVLAGRVTGAVEGTAAKLASIAKHASLVQVDILLTLLQAAYALVLAVTLYALTREEDRELALMGLCCRTAEGVVGTLAPIQTLGLLMLSASTGAADADAAAGQAIGSFLLRTGEWTTVIAATCFAAGSTLFTYLFLRARSIPRTLAWLGLIASVLLVLVLPLRLAGFISGPITNLVWLPMLAFEVPFGLWLLVTGGVVAPRRESA
jgi:hypothetical protein